MYLLIASLYLFVAVCLISAPSKISKKNYFIKVQLLDLRLQKRKSNLQIIREGQYDLNN